MMAANSDTSAIIEFSRFTVNLHRREFFADGKPINLGSRAFDVLVELIKARGTVLSKDELINRVWPDRVIDENNLQIQISALRKALGPDRDLIHTVAGRGYHFTGEIFGAKIAAPGDSSLPRTNLPGSIVQLIGRDQEINRITDLLKKYRLVTLAGAGGIGKTRLCLEAARRLLSSFSDGVWLVELAPLSNPELVHVTVATVLGLTISGGAASPQRVAAQIAEKKLLLVLDNCEHVIDAAAVMAEAILSASPRSCVLATSREGLRLEGERVHTVPPLSLPEELTEDLDDLMQSGAVQLFIARAQAVAPLLAPDKHFTMVAAAICRRLDGLPLAIELAATRTNAIGIEELLIRLDERFKFFGGGNRTALPRHQTLNATFDWSYELLPELERVVLRRLALFNGSFDLKAAVAIVVDAQITNDGVLNHIANLAVKSLIVANVADTVVTYQLLNTTSTYAREKLNQSGELEKFARRHAEHYRDITERAEIEWETRPTAEWLAAYRNDINNIRSALDWAFSPAGDPNIGISITAAAVPLWFLLSLIDECRKRIEIVFKILETGPGPSPRREMQLSAALGWSLMYTAAPARESGEAWTAALELAKHNNDIDYQLRALWGLWAGHINNGEFTSALMISKDFSDLAKKSSDPADTLLANRLKGTALHFLGDQNGARHNIQFMLARYATPVRRSDVVRFQFDQRITAHMTLSRVLWLQGFPDQAMRSIETSISDALAIDHTLSLCNTLAQAACPISLLARDLENAGRFVEMFLRYTERQSQDVWKVYSLGFRGMLFIQRCNYELGITMLSAAVEDLKKLKFVQYQTSFQSALAEGMAGAGRATEGLVVIEEAILRCESSEERWCIAELLRIKGELILLENAAYDIVTAENLFLQAQSKAKEQGALSWELRCAISLGRLWHKQERNIEARERVELVLNSFTEGFQTADLRDAKAFIESIS